MKLFKSIILCLFTIMSFSACSNVEKQKEGIQMIDYHNPKKVCFGRIEVTVPKETEVEYSNFNYNGSNIEVVEDIKNYDAFKKLIADKIQYLKHEPHETEGVLLKQEIQGPVDPTSRMISHIIVFRDGKYVTSLYEIYAYLYLRPNKFLILKSGASNDLLNESIADMQHTLKSIKIRSTKGEEQAGLCWKEFFIADDMSKNLPFMGGNLYLDFPGYPGVRANIDHRIRLTSDIPLIDLMRKNQQELPVMLKLHLDMKNLREHEKTIHGLAGEEVLSHVSQRGHFERGSELGAWQYLGSLDNKNDPYIYYTLVSAVMTDPDEPLNSNVSQKNFLRLNDFILNSIQVSPNNKKENKIQK
ncbi:T6SS immunity protein Tli4 family protein [Acinetobacter sp. WZC-1]|uniref:T6SS immunity protein Tli4 family protein n=1 Tax=Acinetobacter sp. WZC-1 TaxID=3459034 RepID=UPI00403DB35D